MTELERDVRVALDLLCGQEAYRHEIKGAPELGTVTCAAWAEGQGCCMEYEGFTLLLVRALEMARAAREGGVVGAHPTRLVVDELD